MKIVQTPRIYGGGWEEWRRFLCERMIGTAWNRIAGQKKAGALFSNRKVALLALENEKVSPIVPTAQTPLQETTAGSTLRVYGGYDCGIKNVTFLDDANNFVGSTYRCEVSLGDNVYQSGGWVGQCFGTITYSEDDRVVDCNCRNDKMLEVFTALKNELIVNSLYKDPSNATPARGLVSYKNVEEIKTNYTPVELNDENVSLEFGRIELAEWWHRGNGAGNSLPTTNHFAHILVTRTRGLPIVFPMNRIGSKVGFYVEFELTKLAKVYKNPILSDEEKTLNGYKYLPVDIVFKPIKGDWANDWGEKIEFVNPSADSTDSFGKTVEYLDEEIIHTYKIPISTERLQEYNKTFVVTVVPPSRAGVLILAPRFRYGELDDILMTLEDGSFANINNGATKDTVNKVLRQMLFYNFEIKASIKKDSYVFGE